MFPGTHLFSRGVTPEAMGQAKFDAARLRCYKNGTACGGAVAQLEARLDGIEEVVGSNPIGSTKTHRKQ